MIIREKEFYRTFDGRLARVLMLIREDGRPIGWSGIIRDEERWSEHHWPLSGMMFGPDEPEGSDLVAVWGAPMPTPDPDPRDAEIQQLRAALKEAREVVSDMRTWFNLDGPTGQRSTAVIATIDAALTSTEGPRDE